MKPTAPLGSTFRVLPRRPAVAYLFLVRQKIMIMRFHHCGIPTKNDFEGAIYLPKFKMHISDHFATPYEVQWMRFDDDCLLPDLVKTVSHVAFEVDDLEAAIRGKNVIISPNEPSEGVRVAFIEEAGAPIEFLQITK
jgi:hypothetical protein